ncbi:ABC transporter permease [Clostridium sp. MSJ-11]|uniref:ABC transporter permease n=1 Tax=Clostridium mobile TaxID=2841512 RepID=A0ABS6EKV7_9CLOT|nr:ABC transporter permease [Clostridium mobile]MBU5485843.1 ABC transporter permease [Clostridium mobile]
MVKSALKKIYTAMIFTFLYAPIVVLIVFSFNSSKSRANWTGFTFDWYIQLFKDQQIMTSLYNTIMIALIASVCATIIGTLAAIGMQDMKKFTKAMVMNITYLPVLNPDIVTGISLMLLFIFANKQLGFFTMLLAHITINIPYVILSVLPKLKQLDVRVYDAALDLGATPMYAFRKVIIPQIAPGIFTGFLLAFTMSIDDFVISFFTTGSGVSNLSITIWSMARRGVNPKINALLSIMFASVILLLLIVNNRMSGDGGRKGKIK